VLAWLHFDSATRLLVCLWELAGIPFHPQLFGGAELDRMRDACVYAVTGFGRYGDTNYSQLKDATSMRGPAFR